MGGAAWALPDASGEAIATLLALPIEGASFREIDLDPAHFTRTTCCA